MDVHKDGKKIYEIILQDCFDRLPDELHKLNAAEGKDCLARKLCIVTDENVNALYTEPVKSVLAQAASYVTVFVMPAGEEYKTLDTIRNLYEHLILEKFDRGDMLVALGGGVIGDMTGYAAATYLRGIDFIQIPTTLLSQVDSSIGGKTGVDFDQYKNMVGAFHQPKLVYMNLSVLKTLSPEQFASGMGEVTKHGFIRSESYYEWMREHKDEIYGRDPAVMHKLVLESCNIKREVVEKDPHEKGERALLNFGHTIGHAVEKLKDFKQLHGECVALGMAAAAWLSVKKGLIAEEERKKIEDTLLMFDLPVRVSGLNAAAIYAATRSDKKMQAGQIRFILLEQIGHAVMNDELTEEELMQAILYIGGEQDE